jgi:transposase-like protein
MVERPDACPACCGSVLIKSGHACGRQRWRCKGCGRQFTRITPRGKPVAMKREAVSLYCMGLSLNAIGKRLGVSAQSVMRWVRDHARDHCPSRSRPDARSWSSSTRFGTSSKKACKLWIWKAFERSTEAADRLAMQRSRSGHARAPAGSPGALRRGPVLHRRLDALRRGPAGGPALYRQRQDAGDRATMRASGTGSPVSAAAPASCPGRSRWSRRPWPCSPITTATAGGSHQR